MSEPRVYLSKSSDAYGKPGFRVITPHGPATADKRTAKDAIESAERVLRPRGKYVISREVYWDGDAGRFVSFGNLASNPPFYAHNLYEKKTHGLTLHQMRRLYAMVSRGNQKAITYARNVLGIPFSESPSQVKAVVLHHVRDLAERRVRKNPGKRYTLDADIRKHYSFAEAKKLADERVRRFGMRGIARGVSIQEYKQPEMIRVGGFMVKRGSNLHKQALARERARRAFLASYERRVRGNPASSDVTPIVFRTFRSGGEVIALFPYEPGTMDPGTMMSYQHIGQHGAADMGLTSVHTRPSTPDEIRPLKNELERIGYKLKILKRIPGDAVRVRAEKIRSMR